MKKTKCHICKNFNDFEIPNEIINAVEKGKLILFCGAGISTESKSVLPQTFYINIRNQLKRDCKKEIDSDLPFSDLMSLYVDKIPNGRRKLICKIKERFDYISSFPQLNTLATRFHKDVSFNPYINTIITTNWDTYFEEICGCTAIIDDKDVSLWDTFDKRVFKIHGSINNIGSIVATNDDYEKCYDRLSKGLIGDRLKSILASNTVVFIGFSFGDKDLNKIIETISTRMGEFANQYYLVTTDKRWETNSDKKIIPIITDGTYFIQKVNEELIKKGLISSFELYDYAEKTKCFVEEIHSKFVNSSKLHVLLKNYPELILSVAYQDGFIHSLERCIANKKYGEYLFKDYFEELISGYDFYFSKRIEEEKFDMAYYDLGYLDGLISLCLFTKDGKGGFPGFFVFCDEYFDNAKEVVEFLKNNRKDNIYKFCKKQTENLDVEVVPHYMPWYC